MKRNKPTCLGLWFGCFHFPFFLFSHTFRDSCQEGEVSLSLVRQCLHKIQYIEYLNYCALNPSTVSIFAKPLFFMFVSMIKRNNAGVFIYICIHCVSVSVQFNSKMKLG